MIPRRTYTREVDWPVVGFWVGALVYCAAVHLTVAYLVWKGTR